LNRRGGKKKKRWGDVGQGQGGDRGSKKYWTKKRGGYRAGSIRRVATKRRGSDGSAKRGVIGLYQANCDELGEDLP